MRNNFSMAENPAQNIVLPNFVREWRKHRGDMKQEELAGLANLTASSISQLENRKQWFSDSTLLAIATALDCRPGDLLLWPPAEVDALTGPLRQPNEIQKTLERIEGLKPADVTVLLSAIDGFQRANAARPSQARPDGQSGSATPRRESTA